MLKQKDIKNSQMKDFNNKEIMELAPKHAMRDDLALKLFSLRSINTIKN